MSRSLRFVTKRNILNSSYSARMDELGLVCGEDSSNLHAKRRRPLSQFPHWSVRATLRVTHPRRLKLTASQIDLGRSLAVVSTSRSEQTHDLISSRTDRPLVQAKMCCVLRSTTDFPRHKINYDDDVGFARHFAYFFLAGRCLSDGGCGTGFDGRHLLCQWLWFLFLQKVRLRFFRARKCGSSVTPGPQRCCAAAGGWLGWVRRIEAQNQLPTTRA